MSKVIELLTNGDDHLDPDTLAAFAEKALSESGVSAMFAHLTECEHCREILRVHAQLRGLDGREKLSRISAWLTVSTFRTAAVFLCAVLGVTTMLLWSHGSQKRFAHRAQESDTQQRTLESRLSTDGQDSSERKNVSEAKLTPKEKANVVPERSSDTQSPLPAAALRRPARNVVVSRKQHSSDLLISQKRTDSAIEQSTEPSQGPDFLLRTVRFRTLASGFTFRSEPARPILPGPFAAARLDHELSFGPASLKGEQEESRLLNGHPVAVKTALGERRFYWNAVGNWSVVAQISSPSAVDRTAVRGYLLSFPRMKER